MASQINFEELQRYGNLELLAKQVVEGFITGLHKSPFHGFSVEFSEHRLYNPGESIKHIDWKLMARSDKTFVKRYEDETNLRCHLVIDGSSSMFFPEEGLNKIKFSVYSAAAIIHLLRKQRDAFGFTLVSNGIKEYVEPKSTQAHQQLIYNKFDALLNQPPFNEPTDLAPALHQLADTIQKRSLIVIFSDFFESPEKLEQLFPALQHLKFNKHEIILFHVVDKSKEIDFDFSNRPYRFVDIETGDELKVIPNEVKENYRKNIQDFKIKLHTVCTQYGIDLNEAEVGDNFNQVLMPFFVKRGKLK